MMTMTLTWRTRQPCLSSQNSEQAGYPIILAHTSNLVRCLRVDFDSEGNGRLNEAWLDEWQARQDRLDTLHTFPQIQAGDLE